MIQTTDAAGRAPFKLRRAGKWLLRGTELRRSSNGKSDYTTLTVAIAAKKQ